jgi:voltage-gated potassium channel
VETAGQSFADMRGRLIVATALLLGTFAFGVVGFRVIDPAASWVDALYMTANVITSAGFRESVHLSRDGEVFTAMFLVFGAFAVVYFTSVMTAFVVEGDLSQSFRRRRMLRTLQQVSDHYIVCGAGHAGRAALHEIAATKHRAVVVEVNVAHAQRAEELFPEFPVLVGDATSDDVLAQAGIGRARGIVICLDDDKDSLVVTVTARQENPKIRIVARATDERGVARISHAGADSVIAPAHIGGLRMASEMLRPSVVGFLDKMLRDRERNLRIEEVDVPPGSRLAGRRVGEIDFRKESNLLLLAVHQPHDGEYVYNPLPDHLVRDGAQLIVMGDPDGVRSLREKAGSRGQGR